MPIQIIRLVGFDGPNLYGPQTGVLLQAQFDQEDLAKLLIFALKEGGQRIGMIIGYLETDLTRKELAYLFTAHFVTPTPQFAVELARYVIDQINAGAGRDELWDGEETLWDLRQRYQAEILPIQALQLIAEASSRDIPAFVRADGALQIGYGAFGTQIDIAPWRKRRGGNMLSMNDIGVGATPVAPNVSDIDLPWERLGRPIIAMSGLEGAVQLLVQKLQAQGHNVGLVEQADFAVTRQLLAEREINLVVIDLDIKGVAQRGLAFERCSLSAIVASPGDFPDGLTDREELARVAGIPMLVTEPNGRVVLNADVAEIATLAEYAPCPVIYISASEKNSLVEQHRAQGGEVVFLRQNQVVIAQGAKEQTLENVEFEGQEFHKTLAVHALLWAMARLQVNKLES